MLEISPSEIKFFLNKFLVSRLNIILLGPPGIGKSISVEDFAQDIARRENIPFLEPFFTTMEEFFDECPNGECVLYVYLNVNASLPIDIAGLPEKFTTNNGKYVAFVPLVTWLACREAKYCIVVIDEFNTVQNPDMEAVIMRLLSECRAGNIEIGCRSKLEGKYTIVVALGNPPEYSAIAKHIPAPIMGGKAGVFYVKPPTVKEWIVWMHDKYGDKWYTEIAGFLVEHPENLVRLPSEPELIEAYPTPRGWTKASILCYNDEDNCTKYISSFCGSEAAAAFESWLKLTAPTIDDVLKHDSDELVVKAISYAGRGKICSDILDDNNRNKVVELIKRLHKLKSSPPWSSIITYVASPHCPETFSKIYTLLDGEVLSALGRGRYELSRSIDEGERPDEEIISELW